MEQEFIEEVTGTVMCVSVGLSFTNIVRQKCVLETRQQIFFSQEIANDLQGYIPFPLVFHTVVLSLKTSPLSIKSWVSTV